MKTLIFDIDGTLTDMWPLERAVLLCMLGKTFRRELDALKVGGVNNTYTMFVKLALKKVEKYQYVRRYNKTFNTLLKQKALPNPEKYPLVRWIKKNKDHYHFLYATGGQRAETLYALRSLGLLEIFDVRRSLDKSTCKYAKYTGIPFRLIKSRFPDCILISDGEGDCRGAMLAGVKFIHVKKRQ